MPGHSGNPISRLCAKFRLSVCCEPRTNPARFWRWRLCPFRTQLEFEFGFLLRLGLVLGGILMRVRPAGPDLVVIVQYRPWRRLFRFRYGVHHQPALPGEFPDIRLGRIGLAQLGFIAKQRVGHRIAPLEPDDFSSNRHPAPSFCLSMIFSENRYPLFRIML